MKKISIVVAAIAVLGALSVWAVMCPNCGGSGILRCGNCGGSGNAAVVLMGPLGPYQGVGPCPACVQRGLKSVIPCNRCSGSGQVYSPSFGGTVYRCVTHPGCSFSALNGHFDQYGRCLGCGCSMAHHK